VAEEYRIESPRPAQASDNSVRQSAHLPTTRSAAHGADQLQRAATGAESQISEVDIDETRNNSSSGSNSSSSEDDDTFNIIRERLKESSDDEEEVDTNSSSRSGRSSQVSSTRSAEDLGLQSTNLQQGGNASATSSVAQHDGNEIQAPDQHLQEHHEGENLVGGSRRSAERGVPKYTSRANVGGERQGDETLSIALEFDPGV
jgi:hypothetical protein